MRTCTSVAPAAFSIRTILSLVVPLTIESSTITTRLPRTTSFITFSLIFTLLSLADCLGLIKVRPT